MTVNDRAESNSELGGFTLVETVLVLVVVGILAATMAGAFMDTSAASVVGEADILRGHLGFVQSLAMANNVVAWSILFGGSAYTLQADGGASPMNFPGEPSAVHVLPAGVSISGGAGPLAFDQWGAPAATRVVTLTSGTFSEPVSITGFTGLVQ